MFYVLPDYPWFVSTQKYGKGLYCFKLQAESQRQDSICEFLSKRADSKNQKGIPTRAQIAIIERELKYGPGHHGSRRGAAVRRRVETLQHRPAGQGRVVAGTFCGTGRYLAG